MNLLNEPSLADGFWKNFRTSFVYAIYEYLENVFLRTTGAQTIRSWITLYSRDEKFQQCMDAGELLSGLTASAAYYDQAALPLVEELKNGRASPVHDFIFHSQDANRMLSDFVSGQIQLTPSKLKEFEQHMQAMAELASQPIAMAQEMRRSSANAVTPHSRPSDYIREVLQAKKLSNPRQLQILFSLVPPLITHGALALSHVEYVPQEKRFISVKQSVRLAKSIKEMMDSNSYEYNHNKDGKPLLEGVATSAIIKNEGGSYRALTEQELMQLGNRLLHHTKEIAGENLDRILNYADEHFEAVEQQLLNSVYPAQLKKASLESQTALTQRDPALVTPWSPLDKAAPHSHETNRLKSYLGAAISYQKRPEASHEKKKLYRRKLPNDFAKIPNNVVKDILKLTNADPKILWKAFHGEKFDSPFLIDEKTGKAKEIRYERGNHLRKEGWGIAMKPLAGSHGLVFFKEVASTGKKLTGDSIQSLSDHLGSAIASGKKLDHAIQESLNQNQQSIQQKMLSISPSLKAKVERVQQKSPNHYNHDDYRTLQEYFTALAEQVDRQSEKLLSPYQQRSEESLEEIIQRNFSQPVSDVPSALMTLSFIQSVLEKEKKNIDSLEYVDPQKNLIPLNSFRRIADYMETQMTSAGIAIVGREYQGKTVKAEGFDHGQMVEYNPSSKSYQAVTPETIIRLANVVSTKFQNEIGNNIDRIQNGKIDKSHYAFVEKKLFESPQPDIKKTEKPVYSGVKRWDAPRKAKRERSLGETINAALKHGLRPEAFHEASLLWSRTTYARFIGIPVSLWQNIRKGYVTHNKDEDGNYLPKVKKNTIKDIFNSKGKKTGSYISRGSILSELYISIAYPLGEFISVIGREMLRYKVADTIADASHASDTMSELLHKVPTLSTDWEKEYRETTGKSAALEQAVEQETFKMIPRIAMKPAHLRLEHENLLMQQYMEQAGSTALASVSQLMANPRAAPEQKNNLLESPVTNLAEAYEAIATIKATMDASRQHLGVLRFVDQNKVMFDAKGLAQLSETIETQYKAADKAGDLNTEQGFIRLSKVIRDEFLAVVSIEKLSSLHISHASLEPINSRS